MSKINIGTGKVTQIREGQLITFINSGEITSGRIIVIDDAEAAQSSSLKRCANL